MTDKEFNVSNILSKETLADSIVNYFQFPPTKLKSIQLGHPVGSGLLSTLTRLNLTWDTENENGVSKSLLPTSLVVKIRSNENTEPDTLQNSDSHTQESCFDSYQTIHLNECNFYRYLGKIVPIPVPKCFYSFNDEKDGSGVLVLEDMGKFKEADIFEAISLNQLYEVVDCLTKLQAYSLKTKSDWRQHFKYNHEYKSFYNYLHNHTGHTLNNLKIDFPSFYDCIDFSVVDFAFDIRHIEVPIGRGVITHGDLWIHNILFDPATNKVGSIVDWQFVNIGNFADDIARLMVYSVATENRRQNQRSVLLHYYENLRSILDQDASKLLPDFESLYRSYEISFACQAFSTVCDFSLMLEEWSKMKFDSEDIKMLKRDCLLNRGAATLLDAQNILKKVSMTA